MGVDCQLAVSITVQPEFIVYSLAKACGETPLDSTGQPNPYMARKFIWDSEMTRGYTFFPLQGEGAIGHFSLHLSYENQDYEQDAYRCAEAPVWLLMGRATAENIAILRTVAEVWGGRLIFRDSDDQFQDFSGRLREEYPHEADADKRWEWLELLAFTTPEATVTEADNREAAYR